MTSEAAYVVHAIRYAMRDGRRAENFLDTDPHDGPMPMDYFIWVAQHGSRSIVIDTGFSRAVGERRGRTFLRCPAASLRLLGVAPEAVEDVVVTHLHNDHAGNWEHFPSARFHLQEAEMAFATGRYMRDACCGRAYELDQVLEAVRMNYGGRVEFHDGVGEIADGLTVHPGPGHTPGLQFVRIRTRRGWLVLASDVTHYYENIGSLRPFRLVYHVGAALDSFRAVLRLVSSPDHVIPGHDPRVMERYPAPREDLRGIAVRLD
jgi:glyoxylase-like metal-dependent hydrolase (beta-lactamase superfamily II)